MKAIPKGLQSSGLVGKGLARRGGRERKVRDLRPNPYAVGELSRRLVRVAEMMLKGDTTHISLTRSNGSNISSEPKTIFHIGAMFNHYCSLYETSPPTKTSTSYLSNRSYTNALITFPLYSSSSSCLCSTPLSCSAPLMRGT